MKLSEIKEHQTYKGKTGAGRKVLRIFNHGFIWKVEMMYGGGYIRIIDLKSFARWAKERVDK